MANWNSSEKSLRGSSRKTARRLGAGRGSAELERLKDSLEDVYESNESIPPVEEMDPLDTSDQQPSKRMRISFPEVVEETSLSDQVHH